MIELQIINKILSDKNDSILKLNNITDDYFVKCTKEYNFIKEHQEKYGVIPDIETFLVKFPDFDVFKVNETNEYLVDTFREQHLFNISTPIFEKFASLYEVDSIQALDYIRGQLPNLQVEQSSKGVDIISQADERLEEYKVTKQDRDNHFLKTGFEELDEITGGLHKGEEYVVLFARTGQGKSWVLFKMLEYMWQNNNARVGLIEPEMSAVKTGYRFDTIHKNISNKALLRGENIHGYDKYIKTLSKKGVPFFVAHPRDFNRKVTVSKLKAWAETNHLDVLAVDGISYLYDERMKRGDNKTTQLTNISEDLMQLSIDLEIPVLVVVQSNREGAQEDDLSLTNIRDSDGIAYNASMVISIQQKDPGLVLGLPKSRNSINNVKLTYLWDIDIGKFEYMPGEDSGIDDTDKAEELRRSFDDTDEEY